MVELESWKHKLQKRPFWANHKIFFGFGANKYDAAWKEVEQKIDPSMNPDEIKAIVEQGIKDL